VNVHITNPLSDSRWPDLVARHPRASVFHRQEWIEALAHTYGYQPLVLTSAPPGQPLSNGIVLCRISSWLTGTRLVSLPFSDHCDPLVEDSANLTDWMKWLSVEGSLQSWEYVELRPLSPVPNLQPYQSYLFHEIDLRPSLAHIFCRLHKNSIQRRIRRAEKEGVTCETGRSTQLVDEFYKLLLMTRRRHKVIPQPLIWFKNLVEYMGDGLKIWLARKNGIPIAAMITLRHQASVVYKYGCSNEKFHHLGGVPFLFWRLIEHSKASGAEKIDLGRSDLGNQGLIAFKDKLGASRMQIAYCRHQNSDNRAIFNWDRQGIRLIVSMLPDSVFTMAGSILYRHIG
jgi:Acetyltransferase (GNAT) domain